MTSIYLYRIQPSRSEMLSEGATAEEEMIIIEHFAYLEKLTDKGVVLLAGRTLNLDPASFGIVILSAVSEDAARQIMQLDPAVKGSVMSAELFPFRIALCSHSLCEDGQGSAILK
ncbi:MAG: YciI family protein [Anaerolineaceae bacterium]